MTARRDKLLWIAGFLILLASCTTTTTLGMAHWTSAHTRAYLRAMEQAAAVLDSTPAGPAQVIAAAQPHIAAARLELDTLRPVAEPVATQAGRLARLPLLGPPAEQLAAAWTFANATTSLAEELANAAGAGLAGLEQQGVDGVAAAIPAIQSSLQATAATFQEAQAARARLNPGDGWPGSLAGRLEAALTRWDALAPRLEQALVEIDLMTRGIDLPKAWQHAQAFGDELAQVEKYLAMVEENPAAALAQARPHLLAARAEMEALRPAVELMIARADRLAPLDGQTIVFPAGGRSIPQMGAWWRFANAALGLGEELSGAGELILLNLDQDGTKGLIAAMPALQDHLALIQAHFAEAQAARAALKPITWLPGELANPLNESLQRWDELDARLQETLPAANRFARALPLLLGSEGPVTYLLLIESSDELRATGGFIGSIGLLRLEEGRITAVSLGEVSRFDNIPLLHDGKLAAWTEPPAPLVRYMGLGHWYLRDANWWADFPASARQANEFWAVTNATPVDGVIAITDQGVENLLKFLGPVQSLAGQRVDAQNLKEFAAAQIYQEEGSSGAHQAALLQDMALVFAGLTRTLSPEQSIQLGRYLREAVARRDLLITSLDPDTAAIFHAAGLDGALNGQQDDYLYLVETNVSYSKLSPFIQQDLTYEVELRADGRPGLATLTVDELNTYTPGAGVAGYPAGYYSGSRWNPDTRHVEPQPGYYGGYTRLYPALNSTFLAATGFDDGPEQLSEQNRPVMGGYVGLLPGNPRQLQFKWQPGGQPSTPGWYRLLVQRQPGGPVNTLSVRVKLPAGYRAAHITPLPLTTTADSMTWHVLLDRDQSFAVQLEPVGAVTAPVVELAVTPRPLAASPAITRPVAAAPPSPPEQVPQSIWLTIPAIGVAAPIVPVGQEPSGIMASPPEADLVGWYELGARPGEYSNAVLAGHVDWRGKIGVFTRLSELQPGDVIEVQNGPAVSYHYVVESLESYQADTAPVEKIFGATPGPVLTLITCGGPYDILQQAYRDRLVVRARGEW